MFRAKAIGGTFGSGTGPELSGARASRGAYRPMLTARRDLSALNLLPLPVAEVVLRAWSTGAWWDRPVLLVDPDGQPPVRVRAGAIVIRDGLILLIARRNGAEHWYEIPGGGVEDGETPDVAVVRELGEETGLAGVVGREVAIVFKEGRREHYFTVHTRGEIAERAGLDLEDDAMPVWLPMACLPGASVWPKRLAWRIAGWHANAWPVAPVRLCDSIVDLTAPCDW